MTQEQIRITPPFGDQTFDNFQQWVSRASSWLTCHPEYNNTEHGEAKGWRGKHFTALCFDSFGRRCSKGGDMQRAQDEGAFPVWWIWPDQIVEALSPGPAASTTADSGNEQVTAVVEREDSREAIPLLRPSKGG